MFLKQVAEHTIWPAGLSRKSTVLDLGANRGAFSTSICESFQCRCIAVEANPAMFARIQLRPGLTAHNLAIAARSGPIALHVSGNDEASSILDIASASVEHTIEVQAVTLGELVQMLRLDRVDMIKFDIEGAEIDVLDSCPDEFLVSVGQLTIEFHDFVGWTPTATVERVVKRLQGLGFYPIKIWRHAWGDTLFVNRRLESAQLSKLLWSRYLTRNWWGLQRIMRRRMKNQSAAARTTMSP